MWRRRGRAFDRQKRLIAEINYSARGLRGWEDLLLGTFMRNLRDGAGDAGPFRAAQGPSRDSRDSSFVSTPFSIVYHCLSHLSHKKSCFPFSCRGEKYIINTLGLLCSGCLRRRFYCASNYLRTGRLETVKLLNLFALCHMIERWFLNI